MFREVARKKQIIPREECIELLINEPRGVLSVLGDDEYPYGMPMNHYYCEEDGKIYFHGGKKGHKIDAISRHDKAYIEHEISNDGPRTLMFALVPEWITGKIVNEA